MKTIRALLVLLVISSIICFTAACSRNNQTVPAEDMKKGLRIYTTFYPLYDFTKKIAGDNAQVENLVPAGVEPHDFELSPKQAAKIYDADIFIFLGESMEPWAKKMARELDEKGVTVIEAGKGLVENDDPHIWLDPVLAGKMAQSIYDGIVSADKGHAAIYEKNMTSLTERFDELDKNFKEITSHSLKKDVVTSHGILGYAARRYGFNQVAITGLSPQEEPSPKKMAELVKLCRTKDIKYIFTEPGGSSKLSETLARETGTKILQLNPLESLRTDEIKAGEDYFSIMEKNLEVLRTALGYEYK